MLLMLMLLMTTTTTMMMIMIYDDDDYIYYKKLGQKYKYITRDNKYNAVKFLLSFIFSYESEFSYPITVRFSQKGEYYKKCLTKLKICIVQPTISEGVIHLNFESLYPVWPCSKVVYCSYLQTK